MTVSDRVLVLNRSWVAVHITHARRALTLVYLDCAKAVHPTDYSLYDFDGWLNLSQEGLDGRYIHSPNLRVRVPEVVLLTHFNGFLRHEAKFSRNNVFERDRNRCQYCGRILPRSQLTIDHVTPQSRGGGDSWENLVVACMKCNVRKGSHTPEEAGMPLMHHPSRPAWLPRFGTRVPHDQIQVWQRFVDPRFWSLPLTPEPLQAAE